MALVFSPSSGSHGSFHCEEASTSSIHPWASPVLFVAVCLHLQRQEEVFLSFFFFFNLPSPNLSYPIPWYLFFLIFFFFFLPALQKTDSLVLAKFLLWAAFLTTQFKSGLASHLQPLSRSVLHIPHQTWCYLVYPFTFLPSISHYFNVNTMRR